MKLRRPRFTRFVLSTVAANIRKAPRPTERDSAHPPWTVAWIDETYANAILKIREVLAAKRASLAPDSSLHRYVVGLEVLSDDDLAAAIWGELRANRLRVGCPTMATLADLAIRPCLVTHPAWRHALKCDPCMRDVRAIASAAEWKGAGMPSSRQARLQ